jgi:hypothetical protein
MSACQRQRSGPNRHGRHAIASSHQSAAQAVHQQHALVTMSAARLQNQITDTVLRCTTLCQQLLNCAVEQLPCSLPTIPKHPAQHNARQHTCTSQIEIART